MATCADQILCTRTGSLVCKRGSSFSLKTVHQVLMKCPPWPGCPDGSSAPGERTLSRFICHGFWEPTKWTTLTSLPNLIKKTKTYLTQTSADIICLLPTTMLWLKPYLKVLQIQQFTTTAWVLQLYFNKLQMWTCLNLTSCMPLKLGFRLAIDVEECYWSSRLSRTWPLKYLA